MEGKKPNLLDLTEQLSNLAEAYESLYVLTCSASDIGADRVATLLMPINNALTIVLTELECLTGVT